MKQALKRLYRSIVRRYPTPRVYNDPQKSHALSDFVRYGFVVNRSVQNDVFDCIYYSTHDSGLFSNCSTTMEDVLSLNRAGVRNISISYLYGMRLYKDQYDDDIYPRLFERQTSLIPSDGPAFGALDVHRPYRDLPLQGLNSVVNCLFWPSSKVLMTADGWKMKTNLKPRSTIAIYYRGTDKAKELSLAPIDDYIGLVERIDRQSGLSLDILIQTDQSQVRDAIVTRFGSRVKYFEELPVTTGRKGIHKLTMGRAAVSERVEFARNMIAAVNIISQCSYIITSTCNVGAWIAFYRGNTNNLYQFDENGMLLEPRAPNSGAE